MKKTPLYETHVKNGAHIIEYAYFLMPVRYTSLNAEHQMVRTAAGLFDASHMGEFRVLGPEAPALLQYLLVNHVARMPVSKVLYSPMCNEEGGVIDDLLVYRQGEEDFLLVVNASNTEKDWHHISQVQKNFPKASLVDESSSTSLLAIQGPKAQEILQGLTDLNLDDIKYYYFQEGQVNQKKALVSRTGYTGEDGFEIYTRPEDAPGIWDGLIALGGESIVPAGLGARDTLRLEAAYPLYGNEFHEEISPLKAGLHWTVDFNQDFLGREALKAEKEKGIQKKLVGLTLADRGIPRSHYPVFCDGKAIGEITSGTFSPTLKKGIGLAYVPASYEEKDGELAVEIRKKRVKALLTELPFVPRRVKTKL